MGAIDKATTRYMRMNEVFADAYNFLMYKGKEVISPNDLEELDTKELYIPDESRGKADKSLQKTRDVVKLVTAMTDRKAAYLILGVENQTNVHYAMPVRNLVYDALQYEKQVRDITSYHKRSDIGTHTDRISYLSGFGREDNLIPVITLVIYFSPDEWYGPRSLYEMFGEIDEEVLAFTQDYKLHLIEPARLEEKDFEKFHSSLREVLHLIKVANDADKIQEVVNSDEHFRHLGREEMEVLNAYMHLGLEMKEGENTVSVCLGVETLKDRAREEGRQEAILNNAKSLMENLGLTFDQAMNALQISEEEREKYRAMQ